MINAIPNKEDHKAIADAIETLKMYNQFCKHTGSTSVDAYLSHIYCEGKEARQSVRNAIQLAEWATAQGYYLKKIDRVPFGGAVIRDADGVGALYTYLSEAGYVATQQMYNQMALFKK